MLAQVIKELIGLAREMREADSRGEDLGYRAQRLVAEHRHGAVVGLQGVVEREFVVGEAQGGTATDIRGIATSRR